MNGSRSRRVSHTASGPMTEPNGSTSPARVDRCAATAGVADLLVGRTGQGGTVDAFGGEVGAAVRAGLCLAVQPGRAGRAGPVHDRSFVCAPPWGACWYVFDGRPPGHVRRRPQGDTWSSAARCSDGARSSPGGARLVLDRQPGPSWQGAGDPNSQDPSRRGGSCQMAATWMRPSVARGHTTRCVSTGAPGRPPGWLGGQDDQDLAGGDAVGVADDVAIEPEGLWPAVGVAQSLFGDFGQGVAAWRRCSTHPSRC
jgi:hypothetical protein